MEQPAALPIVNVRENGEAVLVGTRCDACEAIVADRPLACPSCGSRDAIAPHELATTGRLHTYTVVSRSFPGIATPFIACVVALDDGAYLKGTLIDFPSDPEKIAFGLPVKVVFRLSPQKNAEGQPYLCYYFAPQEPVTSIAA